VQLFYGSRSSYWVLCSLFVETWIRLCVQEVCYIDSSKSWRIRKIFAGLRCNRFLISTSTNSYSDNLVRLNLSTPHFRQWHLGARYVINIFTNQISCSSVLNSVSLRIPTTLIRNCSVLDALNRALKSVLQTHVIIPGELPRRERRRTFYFSGSWQSHENCNTCVYSLNLDGRW
jgi:hypothetical protein